MPTEYSGQQITRAGQILTQENLAENDPAAFEKAMEILSYWRACHEEPLSSAVQLLSKSAERIDNNAVVAKRLKRFPSIVSKLRRFTGMKLSRMQDIGGCRAILANEKRVRKLVRELKQQRKDFKITDYIKSPKEDGYRSIHLIGGFSNRNGRPRAIELQVRTAAQHSWATAVEIIDLFTRQAIKANRASPEWRQFFRSASDQLALIEDIPLYNQISDRQLADEIAVRLRVGLNHEHQKRISENVATLHDLCGKLRILEWFEALPHTLKVADEHFVKKEDSEYVLLQIDITQKNVSYRTFGKKHFHAAAAAYLDAEKRAAVGDGFVVALVSTEAVGGIKEAYPNYFADSTRFIRYISASVTAYRQNNPNPLTRALNRLLG